MGRWKILVIVLWRVESMFEKCELFKKKLKIKCLLFSFLF